MSSAALGELDGSGRPSAPEELSQLAGEPGSVGLAGSSWIICPLVPPDTAVLGDRLPESGRVHVVQLTASIRRVGADTLCCC